MMKNGKQRFVIIDAAQHDIIRLDDRENVAGFITLDMNDDDGYFIGVSVSREMMENSTEALVDQALIPPIASAIKVGINKWKDAKNSILWEQFIRGNKNGENI